MNYSDLYKLCNKNESEIREQLEIKEQLDIGNIDIHKNNNELFISICSKNLFDLCKHLYDNTRYEDWIFQINIQDDIFMDEDLICFLARYGYTELAEYIYSKDSKKIDLCQKYNEPIVLATQNKHLEFVKWIYQFYTNVDIFSDNVIVSYAFVNNNEEIIKWYCEALNQTELLDSDIKRIQVEEIGRYACINSSLEIFKFVNDLFKTDISKSVNIYIQLSVKYKKKDIFQYLLYLKEDIYYSIEYISYELAKQNCIEELLYLLDNYDCRLINMKSLYIYGLEGNNIDICELVLKKKKLKLNQYTLLKLIQCKDIKTETLDYFINYLKSIDIILDDDFHKCLSLASLSLCNSTMCKYMFSLCDNKDTSQIEDLSEEEIDDIVSSLIAEGSVEDFKLFIDLFFKDKKKLIDEHIDDEMIELLFYADKLDIFKYILDIDTENTIISLVDIRCVNYTIINSNLKFLEFIYNKKNDILDDNDLLETICSDGNIELLKWYLNKRPIYTNEEQIFCFNLACRYSNTQIAIYLYEKYNVEIINYEQIFISVLKYGDLRLCNWIYKLKPAKKHLNLNNILPILCNTNNCQLIKWLLDNEKLDLSHNNYKCFREACYYDQVEVLLLLYSYTKKLPKCILKKDFIEDLLIKGYTFIVDILINKSTITKDMFDVYTVRELCDSNMVESLIWLLDKDDNNIDIRIDNDIIYRTMCKEAKIYVLKFLRYKYKDIYDFKVDDKDILPIIKDSPEYYYFNNEYDKIVDYYKITKIKKDIDIQEYCSVCYENNGNLETNCGHYYCERCIFKWYIFKLQSCPYCRQDIEIDKCKVIV